MSGRVRFDRIAHKKGLICTYLTFYVSCWPVCMRLYVCTWLSVPASITNGDCVCNWAYACNGPSVCIWLSALDCQCPLSLPVADYTVCIWLSLSNHTWLSCTWPSASHLMYQAVCACLTVPDCPRLTFCTLLSIINYLYLTVCILLLELVWDINPKLIVRNSLSVPDDRYLTVSSLIVVPGCPYLSGLSWTPRTDLVNPGSECCSLTYPT